MEVEGDKKLNIKWGKQNLSVLVEGVTISDLKIQLRKLTNVSIDRQKLLAKGKLLVDTEHLSNIKDNIVLIGNAESDLIISDKSKDVVFIEDLSNEEKIKLLKEKGDDIQIGLRNLGNTCYFNSLIQCFKKVEPLRQGCIDLAKTNPSNDPNFLFCLEFGKVIKQLEDSHEAVVPSKLVQLIRHLNPIFNDMEKGSYKQQDADECMITMLNIFKQCLKNNTDGEKFSDNLIEELFQINFDVSLTNVEDPTDIKKNSDKAMKLVCYIDNNTTELVQGLNSGLSENVSLNSEKTMAPAVFIKKQIISRLPQYLNIQFMRFFWKEAVADMPDSKAGRAKILKSVMFSKTIDIYDMCSPELQEVLKLGRDIEIKLRKDDNKFRLDMECIKKSENMIPTGKFQLIGVVTHQGRSSDSGHYIGWTHRKDDKWTKYDDDITSFQKTQDILDLKGGGDWHMAYICIYKSLDVPFTEL